MHRSSIRSSCSKNLSMFLLARLDGEARQVDRGEAKVASAEGDLAGRVVDVGDDARAAAHVGDLGLGVAGLVVGEVVGRVDEREVREEALCRNAAGQLEEVVVGVGGVVVYALLDLEDVDREDRRLAVAETLLGSEQDVFDDHSALGAGIGAVVDGGKRYLCARAGVHGVEVVDDRFHRLEGRAVGLLPQRAFSQSAAAFRRAFRRKRCQQLVFFRRCCPRRGQVHAAGPSLPRRDLARFILLGVRRRLAEKLQRRGRG